MFTTLTFAVADRIARVTINRPDKLNALNATVIGELEEAARQIAGDEAIAGAVLTILLPNAR